jgi:hypothetical protein
MLDFGRTATMALPEVEILRNGKTETMVQLWSTYGSLIVTYAY